MDIGGVGGEITALEALPSPQEAAVLKHVLCIGIQSPVVALSRPAGLPWDLDEAVVEGQVVTDGVLPLLGVVPVEREALRDELVDATEGEAAVGGVGDGHGDEGDVAVRGLPSLQRPLPPTALGRVRRLGVGDGQCRLRRGVFLHFHHWHVAAAAHSVKHGKSDTQAWPLHLTLRPPFQSFNFFSDENKDGIQEQASYLQQGGNTCTDR